MNEHQLTPSDSGQVPAEWARTAGLERAADALGCDLRYVLVPRQPLEQTVRSRATELARRDMARVQHTMALEGQATDGADVAATLDDLANDFLRSRKLWDDR